MDRQQKESERLPPVVSSANVGLLMGNHMTQILPIHIVRQIDLRFDNAQHEWRCDILTLVDVIPEDDCFANFAAQTPIADGSVKQQRDNAKESNLFIDSNGNLQGIHTCSCHGCI